MNPQNLSRNTFALALAGISGFVGLPKSEPTEDANTRKIVSAANEFLATLSEDQKKKELFSFDDQAQRVRWSNLPTSFVRRAGLSLQEMNDTQRKAAMSLLASALSAKGFEKVQQIMLGDEMLKAGSGNRDQLMFGKDLYYISIMGTPSATSPWTLQFGGHHLAINLTIAGSKGILTPTLTGAQPSIYTQNGKTIRPLGDESDKGLALLQALDENQKKKAVLGYRITDLVLGPGQDGKTIVPEGLKGSEMTEAQKAQLLDVISAWANIVHGSAAEARIAELKSGLDDTYFAWSGPTNTEPGKNISAYYRIQGPKVVIEYSPQRMGGDPSMHVHTMYRDPTNDYGRGLAGQ